MTVRIINKSKHPLPAYATELSAGMDIRADSFGTVAALPGSYRFVHRFAGGV